MKNSIVILLAVCFPLTFSVAYAEEETGSSQVKVNKKCKAKKFEYDSIVCVCDKTYCDSFELDKFPATGQYTLVTSDKNGQRYATKTGKTKPLSSYKVKEQCYSILTNNTVYLNVDKTKRQQKIYGFGGAFTDAVGYNLKQLSSSLVDHFFNSYFGQGGLRYNLARNSIGHSDFSLSEYYCTTKKNDVNMTSFRIADDEHLYKIPYIKRAKKMVKDLLLMSSVWTVPTWMRRKNDDGMNVIVREEYSDALTLYIMKYLEAFKKEGLEHYAVSFANEPTLNMGIEICDEMEKVWTVWTLKRLIKFAENYFLPALEKNFPETKMLFFDDDRNIVMRPWQKLEMKNSSFDKKLELVGFHSYFDSFIGPATPDLFHKNHPNVIILTTELSVGGLENPLGLGKWSHAEYYATTIIEEMNHFTSGWLDWNLLLDTECMPSFVRTPENAPILVDVKKQEFYKQPSYYAIGHFSQFMPRGSVKIGLESQFPTDLEHVCVERPDGHFVAVLQNTSNNTYNVNIIHNNEIISIPATPHSINTVLF